MYDVYVTNNSEEVVYVRLKSQEISSINVSSRITQAGEKGQHG